MPEMRRWWSSSRASESSEPVQKEAPRPEDEVDRLFCESLLGLMQRNARFDYLELAREDSEMKKDPESKEQNSGLTSGKDPRSKRFSWTR